TFSLGPTFHVLATANPVEYEGTYPLPEAQLDRFLARVSFGYPSAQDETDVVIARMRRGREEIDISTAVAAGELLELQTTVEQVTVDPGIARYAVALTTATRTHPDTLIGSSPRGSLALVLMARAMAVIDGRDYVIPEDVKAVAPSALAHRVTIRPELWMTQPSGLAVVEEVLGQVPTPPTVEPDSVRP
ncbi:MAG: MoxR family ATPase, partial [Tetrasphaera sp.]|nr:MoxR family ATPase [Tetrasphaera sp.]